MRQIATLFLSLLYVAVLCAQESTHTAYVGFVVNRSDVDASFGDNAATLSDLISVLRTAEEDDELTVTSVNYYGMSSPEGSYQLNSGLAQKRIESVERLISDKVTVDKSIVRRDNKCISWQLLRNEVAASDMDYRDEVLAIIDEGEMMVSYWRPGESIDARVSKLQQLRGGAPWNVLLQKFFPSMRKVMVEVTTMRTPKPEPEPVVIEPEPVVFETEPVVFEPEPVVFEPEPVIEEVVTPPVEEAWKRHCYIKSNGIGWLMLISNIAFEYEFSPRWSLSMPIFYSAVNYFTYKVKFRTAGIQPELRYWFGRNGYDDIAQLSGGMVARPKVNAYVGVHLGIAHFNYALGGDYRRQDHDGKNPAYGGGFSGGVRLPIDHRGRWFMEFTGGVGFYHLYYDKFVNVPNGCEVSSTKKNIFCIDNLSVSVAYRLEVKKKAK